MRAMKNSGVEWIGEIPRDWYYRKIIGLVNSLGSGTTPKGKDDYYNGSIPWINTGDLNDGYIVEKCKTVTELAVKECSALKIYPTNSLIIAMYGATVGKLGITTYDSTTNQACCVINSKSELYLKYLYYTLFACRDYLILNAYGSGQPNISQDTVRNIRIPFCKLIEQQRIANYLDEECGKIDAIIEREQAVIEKLNEYKQSIITEAVTKGLNPHAEMKDSGIEWIGKIPKDWDCIISRFVLDEVGDINHYMPNSVDTGIPYIMIGDLRETTSKIDFSNCKQVSLEDFDELKKKMQSQKGDVIFARYATIGTVCYVDTNIDFLVSYACVIVRPNRNKLDGHYLFYYFKSFAFLEDVKQYINANTQGNVGIEALYKTIVSVPPLVIQQQIVDYLDKKCAKIDKTIETKQSVIDKLTEYKKSLIYEVVTGKKEI